MTPQILSLHRSAVHGFSKDLQPSLRLLAGLGVEGDAHCGATVQHRSRVAVDPGQANLRQVHLLHSELLSELASEGFPVTPGSMGENILTANIELLGLPTGTRLALGPDAVVEVTGLRNPCKQLDQIDPKLLQRLAHRDKRGNLIRLAGIMAIVVNEGEIYAGNAIRIERPAAPHRPLAPV
jgi:MOSC domain-containing protein YiiM